MTENREVLPRPSTSPAFSRAGLEPPFGEPKTAEDWVETAGWWVTNLGEALPEASPMFKALVDVLKECQRRGEELRIAREICRVNGWPEFSEEVAPGV